MFYQQLTTENEIRETAQQILTHTYPFLTKEDKEDIIQKCLIRISRLTETINEDKWAKYLAVATKNAAIDFYRGEKAHVSLDKVDQVKDLVPYISYSIDTDIAAGELINRVHAIIDSSYDGEARKAHHLMIKMRWEGYSYKEIHKATYPHRSFLSFRNVHFNCLQLLRKKLTRL